MMEVCSRANRVFRAVRACHDPRRGPWSLGCFLECAFVQRLRDWGPVLGQVLQAGSGPRARSTKLITQCDTIQCFYQTFDIVHIIVEMARYTQQPLTVPPCDGDFDPVIGPEPVLKWIALPLRGST